MSEDVGWVARWAQGTKRFILGLGYPLLDKTDTHTYRDSLEGALARGLSPNTTWDRRTFARKVKQDDAMSQRTLASWPHFNTPLHHALWHSELGAAGLVLEKGADVNQYNALGRTPLHDAILRGKDESIQLLLQHKADPNILTRDADAQCEDVDRRADSGLGEPRSAYGGESCIQCVLYHADVKALGLLLAAGADPRGDPWTALDLAIWAGDVRCAEVLMSFDQTLLDPPLGYRADEVDLAQRSRDLLDAADNEDLLVPPRRLYGAYCQLLQQAVASTGPGVTLVDAFTSLLKRTANVEEESRNTNLCEQCARYQDLARRFEWSLHDIPPFTLHKDSETLEKSGKDGCPLCCIVADSLEYMGNEKDGRSDPSVVIHGPGHDRRVTCGRRQGPLKHYYESINWARLLNRMDRVDHNTGSDNAMKVARYWLHSCRTDDKRLHGDCLEALRRAGESPSLPTRLIHLAAGSARLVETKGMQATYCALSYCWGPGPFVTTVKGNLGQHGKKLPVDTLPQLLQDAMTVARALDFEYIWIDALCIVQDDPADFGTEVNRMHGIYANADLTISTTASDDCRTSLFQDRTFRSSHGTPLPMWLPRSQRYQWDTVPVLQPVWPRGESKVGPIHTRAWTLQEQQMSTRILWFGREMVSWECVSESFQEARTLVPSAGAHQSDEAFLRLKKTKRVLKGFTDHRPAFRTWQELLEQFSQRNITKETDRLPAFTAVMNALTTFAGCESAHGLWLGEHMVLGLCWKLKQPSSTAKRTDAPSWLWASVRGEISFGLFDTITHRTDEAPLATLVSLDTSVDETLSRVSGPMTLRGSLLKKKPLPSILSQASIIAPSEHSVFFDEAKNDGDDYYIMPLMGVRGRYDPHSTGVIVMILRGIQGTDHFRRVGIGMQDWVAGDRLHPASRWLDSHEKVYKDRDVILV